MQEKPINVLVGGTILVLIVSWKNVETENVHKEADEGDVDEFIFEFSILLIFWNRIINPLNTFVKQVIAHKCQKYGIK